MEYTQELILELNSNTAYSTVGAKQGDNNSRVIHVYVTENGASYNLSEHGVSSAYFRLRKPDGKAIINTASISDDGKYISIVLTSQALAVAGRGYADVTLMTGSQILSTVSFILLIMASPQIAEQATSSNEFGYLNAVVEDATHTIYEAEAWAAGTRGGQPVYGQEGFTVQKNSALINQVSVDEAVFKAKVGSQPGVKRTFTFSYTADNNWSLITKVQEGNTVTKYNPEIVSNINDYGIIISLIMGAETPNPNDEVIVTIEESDKTYQNNAKYYSELASNERAKIENLGVSAEPGINAGVEKTQDQETGFYNLHFILPKGDTGNVNLFGVYVDTDIESETYGQVIVVRPDSILGLDFIEYPEGIIITSFNRELFIQQVQYNFSTYIFTYHDGRWYLDDNPVIIRDYGIEWRSRSNSSLHENDKIKIKYTEQMTFTIDDDGNLVLNINTEGV